MLASFKLLGFDTNVKPFTCRIYKRFRFKGFTLLEWLSEHDFNIVGPFIPKLTDFLFPSTVQSCFNDYLDIVLYVQS